MSEPVSTHRGVYYRAEAERVSRLAAAAEPGRGRERFAQAAEEYRSLARYYETLPTPECELEPAGFPVQ